MITVYNIRGTNGSGKSTLARAYSKPPEGEELSMSGPLDLHWYHSPTQRDPDRRKSVEGFGITTPKLSTVLVGSYKTACGGLDAVPDFARSFSAINKAVKLLEVSATPGSEQAVIAEGILASTVWGSWGDYAMKLRTGQAAVPSNTARVAFCYLDTPLEVCLERIVRRQEAAGKVREIKRELVEDKVRAIAATRRRALEAGELVYDIPYQDAERAFRALLTNDLVACASTNGGSPVPARERYRAR